MNDKMHVTEFKVLFEWILEEYKSNQKVLGVMSGRESKATCKGLIGPAAGPHTQMAGNLVAAFIAGADCFELKTVQILEGVDLGIKKPCIYAGHEVYNTEWSTELTVEQARDEYIKAYLLNYILSLEFELANPSELHYIMSVGYDLAGIQSEKISGFIDTMKDASKTDQWKEAKKYLKEQVYRFKNIREQDLDEIPAMISNTVALSTMHGCRQEEIETIIHYLMDEKEVNTYVKMNPTLLGKERINRIFNALGYEDISVDPQIFEQDMSLSQAVPMIGRLIEKSKLSPYFFGVKLTNSFPIVNKDNKLAGDTVYMTGIPLYPIAIWVAYELAAIFGETLKISYSGGADANNIDKLVQTGMCPITMSSALLKRRGYKNLTRMKERIEESKKCIEAHKIDVKLLKQLAEEALHLPDYRYKPTKVYEKKDNYSAYCSVCTNCVDVCPNRANQRIIKEGNEVVVHIDAWCNACGNCSAYCIKGHEPYKEKWTVNHLEDLNGYKMC